MIFHNSITFQKYFFAQFILHFLHSISISRHEPSKMFEYSFSPLSMCIFKLPGVTAPESFKQVACFLVVTAHLFNTLQNCTTFYTSLCTLYSIYGLDHYDYRSFCATIGYCTRMQAMQHSTKNNISLNIGTGCFIMTQLSGKLIFCSTNVNA